MRIGRGPAILALVLSVACLEARAETPGRVEGRVSLAIEGVVLADVVPIVVYLEPTGVPPAAPRGPAPAQQIRQRNARFTPGFLTVAAGQSVDMPNDDAIYHNVFSYSKGNAFDLGLYPANTSRQVTFARPGVIKIYCSIHESMNATVFVAPTRHFAIVAGDGRFAIPGVPPGSWQLRTWCERLPDTQQELMVHAGRVTRIELALGGPSLEPTPPRPRREPASIDPLQCAARRGGAPARGRTPPSPRRSTASSGLAAEDPSCGVGRPEKRAVLGHPPR